MGGRVQSPLRKTARCIRHVISIVACAHCARWLWSFQHEFGFNWNTLTMIIGFFWTPRSVINLNPTFFSKGIVKVSFVMGMYGIMKLIVRDYYIELVCKSLSLIAGLKCIYLIVELASTLGLAPSWSLVYD
jgi:hypothetical protein